MPNGSALVRRLASTPRRWLSDARFTRLMTNSGTLLSAHAIRSLLGLLSMALIGRALGPEGLGIMAAIVAYVMTIDHFVNFQSWKGVIRFGAEAMEGARWGEFKQILKYAFFIDVITAMIAGAVAFGGLTFAMDWFGWPQDAIWIVFLFSVRILFNLTGVPLGVLRLYDKFRIQAIAQISAATVRCIGIAIAFFLDGSLGAFAIAWVIADTVESLIVMGAGYTELKRRVAGNFLRQPLAGITQTIPGILRFFLATSFTSSIALAVRQIDVLVVAAFLGPGPTGLYRVARQFSELVVRAVQPLTHAIYPELSKLVAARDFTSFKSMVLRSCALGFGAAVAVWICYYLFGAQVIELAVGPEFAPAYEVMLWCVFGMAILVAGFPFDSCLLALGKAEMALAIASISTAIYLPLLVGAVETYGLLGAGWSLVAFALSQVGLTAFILRRALPSAR